MSLANSTASSFYSNKGSARSKLQTAAVSLIFLTSSYVKIEPAVCDVIFFITLLFFYKSGLKITPAIMPLFALLLVYNVGGLISYMQMKDDDNSSYQFVFTSFYMAVSAVFIAAYVAEAPVARYLLIIRAYWIGATIAAILGLIGYFQIGPFAESLRVAGRATGGFKDPNVFSTYLVLPAVAYLQALALGTVRRSIFNLVSVATILLAVVLAFSRGAWVNIALSTILMLGLTFLLAPRSNIRGKVAMSALLAIGAVVVMIIVLMSFPEIRSLLIDRFTLIKSYDAGETGRFGNQLNSIPILILQPLGLGPSQFPVIFRENPHNSFINAFSTFGWLGGVTYITLVCSNLYVGFRTIFLRTSFQPFAIVVFSCLVAVTFQAVQIDTEHWRHLYWIMGLTWGFFAATFERALNPEPKKMILSSWQPKKPRRFVAAGVLKMPPLPLPTKPAS
jgi:hypothetical protein